MQDVLTAIRIGVRVDDLGRAARANAEERLRDETEMRRLFAGHEDAVDRAGEIAARLRFSLDELRYEYPSEIADGETAAGRLTRLAREGPSATWWPSRGRAGSSARDAARRRTRWSATVSG